MLRDPDVRRRLLFGALIVISLVLLTAFFREPATGALHGLQRGTLGYLTPLQSTATRAIEPFQDGYRWAGDLLEAHSRNENLQTELEGLRGRVVQLEEADQENRRLKELLDFREAAIFPAGSEFVVARVIGRSPTRWQEWVHIDKGSADGLKLNQPVVGATNATGDSLSGKGLVGKVVGVSENAAQIQLITDPESSVAALIQQSRARGIVVVPEAGRLVMDYVERDQRVEAKQIVETSGFGEVYPKGIPVGVVQTVGEEDVNVYKQIEIRTFVDFGVLEEVMVVISPAVPNVDESLMEKLNPTDKPVATP